MRTLVLSSVGLAGLLAACAAEVGADTALTCEGAADLLAGCPDSSTPECSDGSPAAQMLASTECVAPDPGKADWFGNAESGESCSWNWECASDAGLVCRFWPFASRSGPRVCGTPGLEGELCSWDYECDAALGLVCRPLNQRGVPGARQCSYVGRATQVDFCDSTSDCEPLAECVEGSCG